ncbi:hypothetical protein [Sphingopyxis sp. GW247-27LB]|uniref:hypothetical protein n=1 Tax=Sphingopyxis sp. GW247-27LB TaxID=2012632 RepID=UPI000BA7C285|nr:hypothetical protein [Sphingopyxis sp. GW247-27LB]PAL25502.1 hypothetical protein CD928_03240 [Sphingopyxis sp. GW247-27LB]
MSTDLAKLLSASGLLGRSSRVIRANVASLIETSSKLDERFPGDIVPVPGTIDPRARPLIESYVQLLRDIDAWVGAPLELGPDWLDEIIARRGAWEGGVQ